MRHMQKESYVLVSAGRNEQAYIEGLIDCIAAQTVRPLRWIIVDDGSTDETFARATARAATLPFIQVVKMTEGRARSFASKIYAVQRGCELLKDCPSDYIGFLDADILAGPEYYAQMIACFQSDPQLGLAGGAVLDKYEDRVENPRSGSEEHHVPGGVQFFRRRCFDQIGGYVPIAGGGEDTVADVMCLMHGWKIRVFPQYEIMHLRPDGSVNDHLLERGMKWGRRFYLIGYHPLYYCGQCLRRIGHQPVFIGSLCMFIGFIAANLKRPPRPVSREFIRFLRKIQMQRLGAMMTGIFSRKPS